MMQRKSEQKDLGSARQVRSQLVSNDWEGENLPREFLV